MNRKLFWQRLLLVLACSLPVLAEAQTPPQSPAPTPPSSAAPRNPSSGARSAAGKPKRATPAAPVNLNTATMADLQTLPGIGQATAARILEYRQKNGGFRKIEDLMNVKGIGEKTFLKLKPLLTLTTKPL